MFSRTTRSLALASIFIALAMMASGAYAQAAPTTLDLAMTGDEWDPATSNSSATKDEGVGYFQLTAGGSGTTIDPACTNELPGPLAAAPKVTRAVWVLPEPVSPFPTTPQNNSTLTFTLASASATGPTTTGSVSLTVYFGWIPAGGTWHEHDAWTDTESYTVSAPSTTGRLPNTMTVEIPFGANPTAIPGDSLLYTELTISCTGRSDFTVTTGSFGYQYLIGSPGDDDTDGDGIPDPYDDDDDGDGFTDAVEQNVGADPSDGTITPQSDSTVCSGFTLQEVVDETGDPNECPEDGGIPWVLILLILVVLIVLGAGGYAGMMLVNRGIKLTISHDGFQSIEKGETARYELTVQSTSKKEGEIPVLMELKGVPEDWTATLSPDQFRLAGGEAAEPLVAILTIVPPPGSEHEEEAEITVTATPTDEEGKTSALKPGASVKSKTIVNIGITPPEGEGKKKKVKKPKEEAGEAADEGAEPKKKRFGRKEKTEAPEGEEAPADEGAKKSKLGGLLKRKKGEEDASEDASATPAAAPAAGATAAAGAAAAASGGGKPQLAMGKMVHDPEGFSAGEEVKTTVPVSNKGDAPVENLRLSLFVNDERVAHENLDLSPGEKKEVVFKWTARPDENRVRVKGDIIKK